MGRDSPSLAGRAAGAGLDLITGARHLFPEPGPEAADAEAPPAVFEAAAVEVPPQLVERVADDLASELELPGLDAAGLGEVIADQLAALPDDQREAVREPASEGPAPGTGDEPLAESAARREATEALTARVAATPAVVEAVLRDVLTSGLGPDAEVGRLDAAARRRDLGDLLDEYSRLMAAQPYEVRLEAASALAREVSRRYRVAAEPVPEDPDRREPVPEDGRWRRQDADLASGGAPLRPSPGPALPGHDRQPTPPARTEDAEAGPEATAPSATDGEAEAPLPPGEPSPVPDRRPPPRTWQELMAAVAPSPGPAEVGPGERGADSGREARQAPRRRPAPPRQRGALAGALDLGRPGADAEDGQDRSEVALERQARRLLRRALGLGAEAPPNPGAGERHGAGPDSSAGPHPELSFHSALEIALNVVQPVQPAAPETRPVGPASVAGFWARAGVMEALTAACHELRLPTPDLDLLALDERSIVESGTGERVRQLQVGVAAAMRELMELAGGLARAATAEGPPPSR